MRRAMFAGGGAGCTAVKAPQSTANTAAMGPLAR